MLRISKLTDYGTLILAHMAGLPDRVHSATGLAETLGLGLPTVSKVLKTLGRHALVTSQRGAHGGYVLSRPATQISVANVIDVPLPRPREQLATREDPEFLRLRRMRRAAREWRRLGETEEAA